MQYYCWSRKDIDENDLKNVTIATANVYDHELAAMINKPFSTQFKFNGSHFKCDSEESWANRSFYASTWFFMPCATNSIPAAVFYWCSGVGCYDGNPGL